MAVSLEVTASTEATVESAGMAVARAVRKVAAAKAVVREATRAAEVVVGRAMERRAA